MRPVLPRFLIVGALVMFASVAAVCLPVSDAQAFKVDIGFVVDTEDGQIVIVLEGDPDHGEWTPATGVNQRQLELELQSSSSLATRDNVGADHRYWQRWTDKMFWFAAKAIEHIGGANR